jgi:chromosome segregation ATPase
MDTKLTLGLDRFEKAVFTVDCTHSHNAPSATDKALAVVEKSSNLCSNLLSQLTMECDKTKEAQITLRKLKKDHLKRKNQLQSEIEHLKASLKKLALQETKSSQRVQFLEEFIRQQEKANEKLEYQAVHFEEEKTRLLEQLSELRKKVSDKRGELKKSERSITKTAQINNKRLENLSKDLEALRQEHEEISTELAEKKTLRKQMEKEVENINEKIEHAKQQSQKLRQDCFEAEEFTDKYNLEMKNSHSTLEQLIASLQLRKKGFEEAIQKETSFIKLLMIELDNLFKEKGLFSTKIDSNSMCSPAEKQTLAHLDASA